MAHSNFSSIDLHIVEMRKQGSYILTIHNWLTKWSDFSQLDEQVVLCHICRVLNDSNLAVSRNEVRKCFNHFYNRDFHGDKVSYLNWIYKEFKVKSKTRVMTSQVRKKSPLPQTAEGKTPIIPLNFQLMPISRGNLPPSSLQSQLTSEPQISGSLIQTKFGEGKENE